MCLSLYPFVTELPLERVARDAGNSLVALLEQYETIEELETTIHAGDPHAELVAKFKLRRVLILHDGTRAGIQDVAVARINSVKPTNKTRSSGRWWARLEAGSHETCLLIGSDARHGTSGHEAYVDTKNVAVVPKATILRREGNLDVEEMREVSKRLITALEIEV